jgi:nitrate reductase beta subunit
MLYDADRIEEVASIKNEEDLYESQLDIFLNPHDPTVIEQARKDGIPENWITGAQQSPVYKMAMEWKVAFPLHPEYRTLPMVWYIPPLSPVQNAMQQGYLPTAEDGIMPDVNRMRIPIRYLANLLTGGKEAPIEFGLKRMLAMRHFMRSKLIEGQKDISYLKDVSLSEAMVEDMYKIMALANYEDRYVIPTGHREETLDAYGESGGCGFSFGNGCSTHSNTTTDLFESKKTWRGRSASGKDNRVNTLFTRPESHQEKKHEKSGGCGSGKCGC